MGEIREKLKAVLPSIPDMTDLRPESTESMMGACPRCEGDNRFVYRLDTQKAWCRQCHPEDKPMNVIDFHIWVKHGEVSEAENKIYFNKLCKEYNLFSDKEDIDFNAIWKGIKQPETKQDPCKQLFNKRNIPNSLIDTLYQQDKITACEHNYKSSIAFKFEDVKGNTCFIQYLTVDESKYQYIDNKKKFHKESKTSDNGFFQCGKSIDSADSKGIVLVEGVINAVSGASIMPDYTWLATGSSGTSGKKVHHLIPYINNEKPLLCAFDNDKAGKAATNKVKQALKDIPVLSVQWSSSFPDKCDINDLITTPDKITGLISDAQEVEYTESVITTEETFSGDEEVKGVTKLDKHVIKLIAGKQPEIIKELEEILFNDGCIFQRGQKLIRITTEKTKPQKGITLGDASRLGEVTPIWLRAKLNQLCYFQKYNSKGELITIDCPKELPEFILANTSGSWKFSYMKGIAETPTLRPDGSILKTPGYDAETGIFMAIDNNWNIPEKPTKEDALNAYDKLNYLIKDYEFTDEESRTAAISAILTSVVRRILPTSPAFCFDAPKMGSGKGLLADTIGYIMTGKTISMINMGSSSEETEKRIGSVILSGEPAVILDNVERAVAGEFLNSLLTRDVISPRILGKSKTPEIETNMLFMFTGNNVCFKGDLIRRVLMSRIDPQCERPEEREFDIDLREYARDNRKELVIAALTIIRAYHVAGCPKVDVKTYGSFEKWCLFARNPLIWIGKVDPCKSREKLLNNDPVSENIKEFFEAWYGVFGNSEQIVKNVVMKITDSNLNDIKIARLKDIVETIALNPTGTINQTKLGLFIAKYKDRIEGGYKLSLTGKSYNKPKYIIEQIVKPIINSTTESITPLQTAPAPEPVKTSFIIPDDPDITKVIAECLAQSNLSTIEPTKQTIPCANCMKFIVCNKSDGNKDNCKEYEPALN